MPFAGVRRGGGRMSPTGGCVIACLPFECAPRIGGSGFTKRTLPSSFTKKICPGLGSSSRLGITSARGVSTAFGFASARGDAGTELCCSCNAIGGTSGCGGLVLDNGDLDLAGAGGGGGGRVNDDVPRSNLGCHKAAFAASTLQPKLTPRTVSAGGALGRSTIFGSYGGSYHRLNLAGVVHSRCLPFCDLFFNLHSSNCCHCCSSFLWVQLDCHTF